ncbi:MAG: hypothetical protein KDF60_16895 [Calditrichaeota bacterium]|nr:hypothetical protein [Calditrichota bacterium]
MRILLLFFFLSISFLKGQTTDWETITNFNNVRDIAFEGENIWAVSDGGAFSYNLNDKTIRKFTNVNALSSVDLASVEIDERRNLVFGASNGALQVYFPQTEIWQDIRFDGDNISDIIISGDTMWVALDKSIAVFLWNDNNYIFSDIFLNFPELVSEIKSINLYNKRIWVASDKGLLSASSDFSKSALTDPQNWDLKTILDGLPSSNLLSLATYQNKLWIGSDAGLSFMDVNGILNKDMITGSQRIDNLQNSGSYLLISSQNNLYQYQPGSGISSQHSFSQNINIVKSISDQDVWVGLAEGGLENFISGEKIKLDGPLKNQIRFVISDHQGQIWASSGKFKLTPNFGYFVYDDKAWTAYDFGGDGWSDLGNTDYIYQDNFDNVWIGSWGGGLAVYDGTDFDYFHNHSNVGTRFVISKDSTITEPLSDIPAEFKNFFSPRTASRPDYEVMTAIKESPDGRIWFANSYPDDGRFLAAATFNSDGSVNLNPDTWQYFGRTDGLTISDGIADIAFDDFGRVWIGTNSEGVYVIDYNNTLSNKSDDRLFKLDIEDNLSSNAVRSIAKDQDGIMWIGTRGGLSSFDGLNVFRHVGDENGLDGPLDNTISQVIVDDFNNKWFATAAGVSILRAGRSAFEPGAWLGYNTKNSGLPDNNVNSIFIDQERSRALIATESGLSIFRGSFAEIQNTFNNVAAGPNPFIIESGDDHFVIRKLRSSSTVKIFTLNGILVRELTTENELVDGSRATWDGEDYNGNRVASGIYLYLAFTDQGKAATGKIAVIRK